MFGHYPKPHVTPQPRTSTKCVQEENETVGGYTPASKLGLLARQGRLCQGESSRSPFLDENHKREDACHWRAYGSGKDSE